jgi:hypothetical protein
MKGSIDEYNKRPIVMPLNFAWNSLAFIIKKQHGPEKTLAAKHLSYPLVLRGKKKSGDNTFLYMIDYPGIVYLDLM